MKPQYVVERLYELTKGDAIITTEVGQNQMWAAQFYLFDPPQDLFDFRGARYHGVRFSGGYRGPGGLPRQGPSSTSPVTAAYR